MKLLRWILLMHVVVLSALLGMFSTLYVGALPKLNANKPCTVAGYVTIACNRIEVKDFYVWQVLAERDNEVVYVEYRAPKLKKMFL